MGRLLEWFVGAQLGWGRAVGNVIQPPVTAFFHRLTAVRSFLNGTWLGHPLHPAITDVPVGAFIVTLILDLANQRTGADIALVIGLLGMVGAALSGLADYADTYARTRDVTSVHATIMVTALVLYLISLALRLQNPPDRTVAVVVAVAGLALVSLGAFIGGDLVFRLGNMVDRHAWTEEPEGDEAAAWVPLDVREIPEGSPLKAMAGSEPLVVVRWGDAVFGIAEVCAHAGGPLAEGKLVGETIECPWHGSRFGMRDGRVVAGPSVFDQPRFEIRKSAAGYEARRA